MDQGDGSAPAVETFGARSPVTPRLDEIKSLQHTNRMQAERLGELKNLLRIAEDDFRFVAEQCEAVAKTDGIENAERRSWNLVGRISREAGRKLYGKF